MFFVQAGEHPLRGNQEKEWGNHDNGVCVSEDRQGGFGRFARGRHVRGDRFGRERVAVPGGCPGELRQRRRRHLVPRFRQRRHLEGLLLELQPPEELPQLDGGHRRRQRQAVRVGGFLVQRAHQGGLGLHLLHVLQPQRVIVA